MSKYANQLPIVAGAMTVPVVARPGPRAPAAAPAAPPPVVTVWRRETRGEASGRNGSGWP